MLWANAVKHSSNRFHVREGGYFAGSGKDGLQTFYKTFSVYLEMFGNKPSPKGRIYYENKNPNLVLFVPVAVVVASFFFWFFLHSFFSRVISNILNKPDQNQFTQLCFSLGCFAVQVSFP